MAFPQDLTVSADGKKLFVVAQGSSKLAIYDTASLEASNGSPSASGQVALSGGGPTGVVVDERTGVAFAIKRDLTSRLKAALPWELTTDQQRADTLGEQV